MDKTETEKLKELIRCRDGCGTEAPLSEVISNGKWVWLAVTGRWRCVECDRALTRINDAGVGG
jgi:hypothetical protein